MLRKLEKLAIAFAAATLFGSTSISTDALAGGGGGGPGDHRVAARYGCGEVCARNSYRYDSMSGNRNLYWPNPDRAIPEHRQGP